LEKKYYSKEIILMVKTKQILGINVADVKPTEILALIKDFISQKSKFYIVTPNPELILMAQKNKSLKNALNQSNLSIPDGVGIKYASKFLFGKTLNIIPGRKLFSQLVEYAAQNKKRVLLLGGMDNEAELCANKLILIYPNIQISFINGPKLDNDGKSVTKVDIKLQKDAVDKINTFKPDFLFVAFGNPKQEIWINNNIQNLNIKAAMAVGGTFRYIAELSKLPPKWMEGWGEWLWRLITEPKRIGRIFNAVVIFPITVICSRLNKTTS